MSVKSQNKGLPVKSKDLRGLSFAGAERRRLELIRHDYINLNNALYEQARQFLAFLEELDEDTATSKKSKKDPGQVPINIELELHFKHITLIKDIYMVFFVWANEALIGSGTLSNTEIDEDRKSLIIVPVLHPTDTSLIGKQGKLEIVLNDYGGEIITANILLTAGA